MAVDRRAADRRAEHFITWEGAASDTEESARKHADLRGQPHRVHYHAAGAVCNVSCHDVEPNPDNPHAVHWRQG